MLSLGPGLDTEDMLRIQHQHMYVAAMSFVASIVDIEVAVGYTEVVLGGTVFLGLPEVAVDYTEVAGKLFLDKLGYRDTLAAVHTLVSVHSTPCHNRDAAIGTFSCLSPEYTSKPTM